MPNQQDQEARLTAQTFSTNYTELEYLVSRYDAFQDLPFSQGQTFVAADALFPGSRFILTEREPEQWFRSLCRFHRKVFGFVELKEVTEESFLQKTQYLYPGYMHENKIRILTDFSKEPATPKWENVYNKDLYINIYKQRNEQIKQYFMNANHKLLVIDVTKEKDTKSICRFLNIPDEYIMDMPHVNKT